jgi:large subunit ribosomal protein L23
MSYSALAPHQIFKRPVLTEKSTLATGDNKYTFIVDATLSKTQLSSAFKAVFNRQVVAVRTLNGQTKTKRRGAKTVMPKAYKKAIFTISGEPLDLFFDS